MVAILIYVHIKLLNSEKIMLKKKYGYNKAFNVFEGIARKSIKLYEYKPKNSDKINTKNEMPEYLKNIKIS